MMSVINKSKYIILVFVFFPVFLNNPVSATNNASIFATSTKTNSLDDRIKEFAHNNINLYDPYDCVKSVSGASGDCGAEITGETMEERIRQIVDQYGIYLMNMQIEYGIPWESQFVNMYAESHIGTDGPGAVSYSAKRCGYMNWHGYTYASNALYGHSLSEPGVCVIAHGDGAGNSPLYDNLLDEITAYGPDFLRNGAYDKAFEYASPENFNLEAFMRTAYDGIYCTSGCWGHVYGSVFRRAVPIAQAAAKEKGWPTSEELAKQYNIPKGGNWSDKWGNIKNYINAEPHSLHATCGASMTTLGDVSDISLRDDSVGLNPSAANTPNTTGTSINASSTSVSGSDITWIGDSYSTGARTIIESKLSGISFGGSINDANSTIQACKNVYTDTSCNANPTNPSALKVLKRIVDAGELKPYLVMAVGTNEGWSDTAVEEFKNIMENQTSTKVIFVNSRTKNSSYEESNQRLSNLANSNSNYSLADWVSAYDEKYFANDSVHPNANGGYEKWVDVIYQTLTNIGAGDDGCNVTTSGAGEAIAQTAIKMAWPEGTDRSVYYGNSGVSEEFKKVAEKWGFDGWPSCSRFASMTILESGVDSDFESILPPKGSRRNNLYTIEKYLDNSPNWKRVSYEERQKGDIIINHAHVEVYIGDDKKAHAGEIGTSSPRDNFGPFITGLSVKDKTEVSSFYDTSGYKWYRSTNASTSISVSGSAAGCSLCREDSSNDSSIINGTGAVDPVNGLTYSQAVQFMKNYGANINDSSRKATGDGQWFIDGCNNKPSQGFGGSNCVTFSAFFLNKFTDARYQGGNGYTLVKKLNGVKTDTTPSVWAIFGDSSHDSHTGVILGYQDGEWIVGHASCRNVGLGEGSGTKDGSGKKLGDRQSDISSGAGFVIKSSDLKTAQFGYQGQIYAHPNVDVEAIGKYLNNRE
ncbi:hypothetical protein IJG04_02445 [Candidatus Saccharibacteria bacterium]|nr:hypothetical protein [Candidatus Saccharibacteria bacterium]